MVKVTKISTRKARSSGKGRKQPGRPADPMRVEKTLRLIAGGWSSARVVKEIVALYGVTEQIVYRDINTYWHEKGQAKFDRTVTALRSQWEDHWAASWEIARKNKDPGSMAKLLERWERFHCLVAGDTFILNATQNNVQVNGNLGGLALGSLGLRSSDEVKARIVELRDRLKVLGPGSLGGSSLPSKAPPGATMIEIEDPDGD